jgi:putative MATE family efflux protein
MAENQDRTQNIVTEGNVIKAILIIALPIITSNLLQSVLEVVDMFFIGRLGTTAIAGGTMSMSLIMLMLTVFFGIMTATAAFISRAYGSKRFEQIQIIIMHALYLSLIFSVLIAIVGFFWSESLLLLLGAELEVAKEGAKFLRPALICMMSIITLMIFVTAFQSTGDSKTPMYVMIIVNIVNIILNPTFIDGMFGLPAYGIAGSAYASLLSRATGVVIMLGIIYYHPRYKDTPVRLPKVPTFDQKLIKEMISVTIPSVMQSGARNISFLLMTAVIAQYGQATVAAYGVCIRLDMLGFVFAFGFCTAVSIMVGQNLGAQKIARAEMAVKYVVACNATIMIFVAAFYMLNVQWLLTTFGLVDRSFTDGSLFMLMVPPSYWIMAIGMTLGFAMNGAGMTKPGMYSAIFGQLIVETIGAAILAVTGHPIEFVCYAIVLGAIVVTACDYYFYRKGDWKRKKLHLGENVPL